MNKEDTGSPEAPRDQERGAFSFVDDSQQKKKFYLRFGERVRQARHQRQLTQAELSALIGIDRAYLSEIETGRRRVSLHVAHKIAHSLDLNLDALLGDLQ